MNVLLIVDMQNDFMPGGALAVPQADQLVAIINPLIVRFELVVATQDWHGPDHLSFAVNHPGKKVGDIVKVGGVDQILWPVHCVRNTKGAELISTLNKEKISCFFYKGTDRLIDSYSAFFDNARQKSTGLNDFLKTHDVTEIYIVGVATDYCVLYSTLDAIDLGFTVTVIKDACRPINLHPSDEDHAFATMAAKGARLVTSNQIR